MIKARRGTLRVPEYEPFIADHLPRVPDLLQRLSWEHRQIEKLWGDLQRLHWPDRVGPKARMGDDTEAGVADQLVRALADHEAAELDVLYPAAARVMTPEWADGARAEHAELGALLDEVDGVDPADPEVWEVFERVFIRALAHFNEEDKVLFPVMRVASPPGDLVNPEGYDFLGLPPGKTMIAVTPGLAASRPALGTGRAPGRRQLAVGPAPRQAQAETETEAETNGRSNGRSNGHGDGHGHSGGNGNGHGNVEADVDIRDETAGGAADGADAGAPDGDPEGATRARPRRLLRRR